MPVNSTHPDYDKMLPKWKRCSDAVSGQDAIHAAAELYLPRLTDQKDADYLAYKQRAGFFNATARTLSGLLGMVFRLPPVISVSASVEPMLADINAAGLSLHSFSQTILEEALKKNRVGILVDSPPLGEAATLADARAANSRPSMQMYSAESIINWRVESVNNVQTVTLVVLHEKKSVTEDEWSCKQIDQWRELALVDGTYRVRIFQRIKEAIVQVGSDTFPRMDNAPMKFIPFLFIGTDDLTCEVDDPPMIDLVDLNLAHYRVNADYEHGCHFTGLPTAVVAGYIPEAEEKLYLGSSSAWVFPAPTTTATFLEFTGAGLGALVANLTRKEQQMAILGARLLEPQRGSVESSDTVSLHQKGEESVLMAATQTVSIGIARALQWLSDWAGAQEEVQFNLNADFRPTLLDPAMLSSMLSAWQMGAPGFSDQELFEKLKKVGVVSEGVTLEEEQERIANRQLELAQQQSAFAGSE